MFICHSFRSNDAYIYTSILTGVRSTYFNVRSKTVPYCLSGKCIGTPTQVLCVILFGLRAIPCVESVTSVVCLCVARLCVVAMFLRYLCRRIDHPSKAKQERLMLFRRCKEVMKLCCDKATDSTSPICRQVVQTSTLTSDERRNCRKTNSNRIKRLQYQASVR